MTKLPAKKIVCANCKSLNVKYYGATLHGYHYYYKCNDCQKYTEYCISIKNMRISLLILWSIIVLALVVFFILLSNCNTDSAIVWFFSTAFFLMLTGYKYRWTVFQTLVLENLPNDRVIMHALDKGITLILMRILLGLFVAAFIAYIAFFFVNLYRY
jgi:hypothetical protein